MSAAPVTRLNLRELAAKAYENYEREIREANARKSLRVLTERLATMFAIDTFEHECREDGTAFAVIDGIQFEAPDDPTIVGLRIRDEDDCLIPIMGVIELGRYLKEKEGSK